MTRCRDPWLNPLYAASKDMEKAFNALQTVSHKDIDVEMGHLCDSDYPLICLENTTTRYGVRHLVEHGEHSSTEKSSLRKQRRRS